ncbi:exosortase B [Paucibacter sp. AS339]|uniref:exosortase B n=1 Tax=Paucibacter hankyongi TaxID=3133434 RepID=UPI0030A69759
MVQPTAMTDHGNASDTKIVREDLLGWIFFVAGFLLLFLPTYYDLALTQWHLTEQGHGPIILALSWWFLFRAKSKLQALESGPNVAIGLLALIFGVLLYAFGRSQAILMFEVSAQIVVLGSAAFLYKGVPALRVIWFPLFFLLFMVPLPDVLVSTITTPLKTLVSYVASNALAWAGYPVGRSGVMITVGQYQLLVADACAGLNSMFTLEALGLVYMNIMNYTSALRNITLAVVLVPISIIANITRVIILILVTYHFGDEAGQGFVHDFAGMVLFIVALTLMFVVDKLIALSIHLYERIKKVA